ncbi:MAG TPA: type 1 glutamine amidotransferase [Caulobacteraceae bacterium]|jgi:GMP synthase-like glutamine amidotransferase
MKLGILETGLPPANLVEQFGDYPAMFRALLGEDLRTETFHVADGALPDTVEACDAYLITGSAAGVYDPLPWIAPLTGFLQAAKGRARLVGICFGHQIMAQAFGGDVIKSPKGWGIGLQRYGVVEHEPWMDAAPAIAIPASHQDQVTQLPPGAQVSLASDFTPYAGLTYDDGRSISFQGHPEFDPAYASALIEARRGTRYTDDQADAALATLKEANDRSRVAGWIRDFLAGAAS